MDQQAEFSYTYSAPTNQEVLRIREKYLPKQETKLEELKRLDALVRTSGMLKALSVGIGGTLIFGLGMCLSTKAIGNIMWLGVILGLVGAAGMLAAFPVYRRFFNQKKQLYAPRILELTAELTGKNGSPRQIPPQ